MTLTLRDIPDDHARAMIDIGIAYLSEHGDKPYRPGLRSSGVVYVPVGGPAFVAYRTGDGNVVVRPVKS